MLNLTPLTTGANEELDDDDEEIICSLAQYTWYAMCMLLLCSIMGLMWLVFLTTVTTPKKVVKKVGLDSR